MMDIPKVFTSKDSRKPGLMQCTSHVLMIRPVNFGYNEQTGKDNAFQHKNRDLSSTDIKSKAVAEFDMIVGILRKAGVQVTIFDDTPHPAKPDAVFPNNWITFHQDDSIITYPMYAPIRRMERRRDIVDYFLSKNAQASYTDLGDYETVGVFLEGTGSMVLDRVNRIAYACESHRTHLGFFERYCEHMGWEPLPFKASDRNDTAIYHTNVMMAIGQEWAVICEEALEIPKERSKVLEKLDSTGHKIISISYVQMMNFAGNILQVNNSEEVPYIILSQRAYESLDANQLKILEQFGELLIIPLNYIETFGGGGVRCMMAEVFGNYS